ncbi:MAG: DUF2922 domain-containing protein [Candidatus Syntrophonatronum acetioxidans]|uniref:DUF2922 domain-containing protein n=1 Tax=Candidatus Syntrophonatronum acetioxidans TaxID=1795816 RepID=A0A424YJI5_9FIRM|nr:MAG: DUF2922 domain-containing protein [Candidatus Syntrophonatronum acetioxidans]
MSITTTLRMQFKNLLGNNAYISLVDPVEDIALREQDIEDMMDHIIDKHIFTTAGGDLSAKVGAELITRTVEELFSVENEL